MPLGNLPIHAGDLNRRISIQQRTTTQDEFGQQVETWNTVITGAWAQIEPAGGREALIAGAIQNAISHVVTIRWRTTPIYPYDRVVYEGRLLNIKVVEDEQTKHYKIRLLCEEGLSLD